MPPISVRGLNKIYTGQQEVHALTGVDLEIRDGEFICVLGPSGCGKSTLLELLAGLQLPTSGEVYIGEKQVTGPSRDIGVVFQESSLFPWRTVLENIEFGLEICREPKAQRRAKAMEYIARVDLKTFEHHYPHQLSGGMRQRAGLARTLVANPKVLLMDEPFGAVDYLTRLQLQADVTALWQKEQKTVVFITHDVTEAVYLADRVVLFSPRPGRVKKIYTVDFPRPREHGHPQMLELEREIYKTLNEAEADTSDYII